MFRLEDRIKETSTSTGTGNLTLDGAPDTYFPFSSVYANGDQFVVTIEHKSANEVEVCLAEFVSATPAIARVAGGTIRSSNSNNPVDFSAGDKDIYISPVAARLPTSPGHKVLLAERFT